jgi:hypothetical protein
MDVCRHRTDERPFRTPEIRQVDLDQPNLLSLISGDIPAGTAIHRPTHLAQTVRLFPRFFATDSIRQPELSNCCCTLDSIDWTVSNGISTPIG